MKAKIVFHLTTFCLSFLVATTPDPIHPPMTTDHFDHAEQAARHDRLELLYLADGRDSPGHPYHRSYTGLWLQHLAQQEAITITEEPDA